MALASNFVITRCLKRALYERHGVREYWLVHPTDRLLFICRLGTDGYGRPDILSTVGPCTPTVIPDLVIDWNDVFTFLEKTN